MQDNKEKLELLLDSIEYIAKSPNGTTHIRFNNNVVTSSPKNIAFIADGSVIIESEGVFLNCLNKFRKFFVSKLDAFRALDSVPFIKSISLPKDQETYNELVKMELPKELLKMELHKSKERNNG